MNLSLVEFFVVTVLAGIMALASNAPPWQVAASVSPRNWLLIGYLGVLGTSFAWFAQLRAAQQPARDASWLDFEHRTAVRYGICCARRREQA